MVSHAFNRSMLVDVVLYGLGVIKPINKFDLVFTAVY